MEIYNNVVGDSFVPRTELQEFQGDLKDQNNAKEISDLAARIRTTSFSDPIKLWYGHDNLILDGHQRLKALNELAAIDFYLADDLVPVIYIKAENIEEAIATVFEFNSMYSVMTEHGKKEFLNKAEGTVNLEHIRGVQIEQITTGLLEEIEQEDIDLTDKNKEIDIDLFDDIGILKLKFDSEKYEEILQLLAEGCRKNSCENNEDLIYKLLKNV